MRRLKVLELIKGLNVGGAEVLLLERLRLSDKDRFDVGVMYQMDQECELAAAIAGLGIRVVSLRSVSRLDPRWLARLRRHLVLAQIDVVHTHSPLMAVGVRAVVGTMLKPRPIVVSTEHSVSYRWPTLVLDALTVRYDDLTIAVSEAVANSTVCRRSKHCEVVLHGVNIEKLSEWATSRAAIEEEFELGNTQRVVSVANLRPEKGHATMLEAARLVHAKLPNVQFYVAGHGPLLNWINDEVARHKMQSYYHLLGRVQSAARLTACADAFVLASDREGRPVALMEALALGVPIVASDVGGVGQMIADRRNGLLVRPNDPNQLAKRIIEVLSDAELRVRLAAAAKQSAVDFDLSRATTIIETQIDLLAGERRR